VQHAHQKGVIHRDLKPSNVLVTPYDGTPMVKVIDFGVARAIGHQLTDNPVYTQVAQLVGTPLYMSPEQAGQGVLDIDTRTDIYALGVLLYELLTGTTPFAAERLREVGSDELRRIICEEEPPRPSARISTPGPARAPASANRKSDPTGLRRLLRGDLDWITLKALEKDRTRRYETASAFAADVQRYLNEQPVHARPPSAWYRLRKFVRRNYWKLLTLALLGAGVLAAAGSLGWALLDRLIRSDKLTAQVSDAVEDARRLLAGGALYEAKAAARRAQGLLETGAVRAGLPEKVRRLERDLAMAERLAEIRLERGAVTATQFDPSAADAACARAFGEYGIDVESLDADEAVRRITASELRVELAVALDDWAIARRVSGKKYPVGWRELFALSRRADPDPLRKRLRDAEMAPDATALVGLAAAPEALDLPPASLSQLGDRLRNHGRVREAIALLRRARGKHPATSGSTSTSGSVTESYDRATRKRRSGTTPWR
jgi:hypothetical protein